MARFFSLLLFSLSLFTSLFPPSLGQAIYSTCERRRNFTAGSPFQVNLDSLISFLSSSAPATGFSNATVGAAPNTVYGLAVCRGDRGYDDCRSCLSTANDDAQRNCPGNRGGTVVYFDCHFRYSDENFFGTSTNTQSWQMNDFNISTVTIPTFYSLLTGLLDNLTAVAAPSARRFAAGSVELNGFQTAYGIVQCTRDLSPAACSGCLTDNIGTIPRCCYGRRGARVFGGSCFIRFEIYPFVNASYVSGLLLPPPPPSSSFTPAESPVAQETSNRNSTIIVAATVVPVVALLAISAFFAIFIRRKRRKGPFNYHVGERLEDAGDEGDSLVFSLNDLKIATLNFSDQNKLGEGGFGKVYKGTLTDGKFIAVKRLINSSGAGFEEFKNEASLVAKLQHRNLVRLLGYCLQDQEKILVYEYLPNKSLEKLLFDPNRSKSLTWEMRVRIVEGIARGLQYLHEDSRFKIIHRDLKAGNILLDENMNSKIADFGLARLFGNEQTSGNTQRIAGTYGYMAPEYVMHGQISTKSDVYSFGVLLLEILTGKKCVGFHGSNPPTDLIRYVSRLWKEGNPSEFLDKAIADDCPPDECLKLFHIGLLCAQSDPLERPNMSQVVVFLSSSSSSLPPLSFFSEYTEPNTYSSQNSTSQTLNTRSPTEISPLAQTHVAVSESHTLGPR